MYISFSTRIIRGKSSAFPSSHRLVITISSRLPKPSGLNIGDIDGRLIGGDPQEELSEEEESSIDVVTNRYERVRSICLVIFQTVKDLVRSTRSRQTRHQGKGSSSLATLRGRIWYSDRSRQSTGVHRINDRCPNPKPESDWT